MVVLGDPNPRGTKNKVRNSWVTFYSDFRPFINARMMSNNDEKSRCNKNKVKMSWSKFLQNLHFAKMMRHVKVCHM